MTCTFKTSGYRGGKLSANGVSSEMTAHTSVLHWPSLRETPPLDESSVHLWSALLDQRSEVIATHTAALPDDERERAERFRFARDQHRYVVGRALLRRLLARYIGAAPAAVRFTVGPHGKPALADLDAHGLHFNVTHADDLVVFALTRRAPVGVDIERVHPVPDLDQVAAASFSARERAELAMLLPASRNAGFFRCWTRKEAYIKAVGEGLSHSLDRFDVSLAPGPGTHLLALDGDETRARAWSLHEILPADGYVGAVAIEAPKISIHVASLP